MCQDILVHFYAWNIFVELQSCVLFPWKKRGCGICENEADGGWRKELDRLENVTNMPVMDTSSKELNSRNSHKTVYTWKHKITMSEWDRKV
ncbi:hypothetical protein [Anaerocolumna xylanovorans]|uniref:Uncharacterized protein n=1 Tax=Anaerocolumna xylanovorans DSM 12503 TaxID=1121345 RepID=A0A1M7YM19_9FIRM|nr:hypothetical protein [Anaerocolumna xylanovorans]SHO53659.1 hypothetical protein SAMN02745217_04218 [Anaerocolumna xylanovorans DSM 12503]